MIVCILETQECGREIDNYLIDTDKLDLSVKEEKEMLEAINRDISKNDGTCRLEISPGNAVVKPPCQVDAMVWLELAYS